MRVLVLGAAVSGTAAARLARRRGFSVTLYDRRPVEPGADTAVTVGAWDPLLLTGMDLVVASPGFPERSAPITDATEAGVPVWSEMEFAWRELDVPTVAVTGTNGKTTVTTLISEMITRSGRIAPPLGNIGSPLSDAVDRPLDVAVVEASSFQLRFIETFRPEVAVVTNITEDHLDWHGSVASYFEAKSRIVGNQDAGCALVYDEGDAGARRLAERAPSRLVPVTTSDATGIGIHRGRLTWGDVTVPLAELEVTDPAFLVDVLLAGAAAREMGVTPDALVETARRFRPGAHRRAVVGERAGVVFVDDSKATNPHAALTAIRAYPSVVLIAGGLAKGLDPTPLAVEPNVRHVVGIGESGPVLVAAAGDRGTTAQSMSEAVELACRHARPGDVVLLAPGCASFDMFSSYADRGDAFARAVSTIMTLETEAL